MNHEKAQNTTQTYTVKRVQNKFIDRGIQQSNEPDLYQEKFIGSPTMSGAGCNRTERPSPIKGTNNQDTSLNAARNVSWLFLIGLSTNTTCQEIINFLKKKRFGGGYLM
ncbi:hypothetical protein HHI36_001252 [Cryptolaemus montrouzieri]|uniref:Uncharacterized protein n=1 Tax=Cryptolaemus montrouzieri TaxID=559131 RepID=A0ABD2P6V2_9CUCU